MPSGIAYLDGHRIRRGLRAGALNVIASQDHLNKINVYPVPDGDTGTNLAMTLRSVVHAMTSARTRDAGATLMQAADAALDGARGNSGAIVAQFFHGVSDAVATSTRLTVAQFVEAIRAGEQYARDALVKPVEGTVLTVMRDFAAALESLIADHPAIDFAHLLRSGKESAQRSLEGTPGQLDALRQAGVVDAGAEGFVRLVDGICGYIESGHVADVLDSEPVTGEAARAGEEIDLDYRFCTECVISGEKIDRRRLKEELMSLGSSLVLAGTQKKARVHIHVNDPQAVFRLAAQYGEVTGTKADDMQRQQTQTSAPSRQCAIVMDSAGDMPDDLMDELGVHMTPVRVHFGNESYLDKVSISADEFYARLASDPTAPKTSQPPPGDFRRDFQFLASHYPSVVCVNITAQASGTFQSAVSAAERTGATERIHVLDSQSISVGQGLLAIHAAEMAQANAQAEEILTSLTALREKTLVFALVRDLDAAVRGGRVPGAIKARQLP